MTRATPLPGRSVRGSTTGRALMAAMDLLGRRWALRIMWELSDGPLGARALLARCEGLSSSVMYERLRELTEAGLVGRHDASGYVLTSLGRKLNTAIAPLDGWAKVWERQSAVSD
ncbi:MAG TPA: helix-turn-helix domain-containing protein [Ilumatobacteraceae bacterium]|nr:helix-turn-helix domain-containing protein [Ilumatobacteraceae bacterium]